MKKIFLWVLLFAGIVILCGPIAAKAEKMETLMGSIQGFECVMQNKVCPIGHESEEAAAEQTFVLLVNAKNGDYYVIPNVKEGVLARLINSDVKVVGYVDKKRNSIWAEEIYMGSKLVWHSKMYQGHNKK